MAALAGLIVALFLVLLAAAGVLFLWRRFHRSEPYQWRLRVGRLDDELRKTLTDARAKLGAMGERRVKAIEALRADWLDRVLDRILVKELDRYPGIGPATVEKLIDHGFTTLKVIKDRALFIPGIGDKRLRDVRLAFEQHVQAVQARLQSGASSEASGLEETIQNRSLELDREENLLEAIRRELGPCLSQVEKLKGQAEQITFGNFLAGRIDRVIPASTRALPLPDVARVLAKARGEAEELWRQANLRHPSAPGQAPTPPAKEGSAPPAAASLEIGFNVEDGNRRLDLEAQFAYIVARCDGHLAPSEKAFIENRFNDRYRDDRVALNRVRGLCAFYQTAPLNVEDCFEKLDGLLPPEEKASLLQFAVALMNVAGGTNPKEARFLEKLCAKWRIELPAVPDLPPPRPLERDAAVDGANETATRANPSENGSRGVLEIEPDTAVTPDLIRRNYHRLMERFDPAKVAELGPEFVQMAQAKREQIEEAARALIAPFQEELAWAEKETKVQELRHNPELDDLFGA